MSYKKYNRKKGKGEQDRGKYTENKSDRNISSLLNPNNMCKYCKSTEHFIKNCPSILCKT